MGRLDYVILLLVLSGLLMAGVSQMNRINELEARVEALMEDG